MKKSTIVLILSLLANAALIGALAVRSGARAKAPTATSTDAPARAGTASAISGGTSTASGPAGAGATAVGSKLWDQLKADDYSTLVAHLRAAGFPPRIVRQVIATLINEKYDARRLELQKDFFGTPFWSQNQSRSAYSDPKLGPQLLSLQREQMDELKKALGVNLGTFVDTDEEKAMVRYQFGDIPPEKLDALYSAFMDYNAKRMKIYGSTNNGAAFLPADRDALASLEKDFRDQLSKFLTPAEATDFNLHSSQASYQLRYTLAAFQPTEDEFRTLLPVYQAFQEQFPGPANNLPPDQEAARKVAQDTMIAQVKAQLGPDRAADFQQAIDPANLQINRLVARLDLPIAAATQVQTVQKDIQNRASAVRADASLAKADQQTQLNALADEASAKISTALGGANGLEAYKMNGGQWILGLRPRAPAPPAPPGGK